MFSFDPDRVETHTNDVVCADLDADGVADFVITANARQRDFLYMR